jgi:hypothetical protein
MRHRKLIWIIVMGALLAGSLGTTQAATKRAVAKTEFGYVTKTLTLPSSSGQADAFGRDLDGDGTKDNQLGNIIVALQASGTLDLGLATQDSVTLGDIVMLHSLRTPSISNTRNATWQVWYGKPTITPPAFDGTDVFPLLSGQPHSAKIAATIKDHSVRTSAGTIPFRMDFGSGPFVLHLKKARVFTKCFRAGCLNGRINGGIPVGEVESKLKEKLRIWVNEAIAADCPGPDVESCAAGSTGETLVGLFDDDEDLTVTVGEFNENSLIQTLLRPDLNLVRGDGVPADHMSVGFGFTTVKAKLTRP